MRKKLEEKKLSRKFVAAQQQILLVTWFHLYDENTKYF